MFLSALDCLTALTSNIAITVGLCSAVMAAQGGSSASLTCGAWRNFPPAKVETLGTMDTYYTFRPGPASNEEGSSRRFTRSCHPRRMPRSTAAGVTPRKWATAAADSPRWSTARALTTARAWATGRRRLPPSSSPVATWHAFAHRSARAGSVATAWERDRREAGEPSSRSTCSTKGRNPGFAHRPPIAHGLAAERLLLPTLQRSYGGPLPVGSGRRPLVISPAMNSR